MGFALLTLGGRLRFPDPIPPSSPNWRRGRPPSKPDIGGSLDSPQAHIRPARPESLTWAKMAALPSRSARPGASRRRPGDRRRRVERATLSFGISGNCSGRPGFRPLLVGGGHDALRAALEAWPTWREKEGPDRRKLRLLTGQAPAAGYRAFAASRVRGVWPEARRSQASVCARASQTPPLRALDPAAALSPPSNAFLRETPPAANQPRPLKRMSPTCEMSADGIRHPQKNYSLPQKRFARLGFMGTPSVGLSSQDRPVI